MSALSQEEEKLQERLRSLESDYKQKLFSKDDLNSEIRKELRQKEAEQSEADEAEIEETEDFEEEPEKNKYIKSRFVGLAKKEETKPLKEKARLLKEKTKPLKEKKQVKQKSPVKKIVEPITVKKSGKIPAIKKNIQDKKTKESIDEIHGLKKIPEIPLNVRPTEEEMKECAETVATMKKEMSKVIVGQDEILDGLIMGLMCNSHVIVEGVPGIAKTLAIRALASVSGCDVKRIQFTVDMLPTDIIGITSYTPEKGFEIIKGPVFTNFLIADEINRSPPKTQSALIEAMQEKQVTIGRENFHLPAPFFVMATENPIENAGVYPLPEAQIDRFLFKLIMSYPKEDEERKIMESNITLSKFEDFDLQPIVSPEKIVHMQHIVKRVYLDENIKSYILSIVRKTRDRDFKSSEFITYGSSPRASIGLYIASKAKALISGRNFVLPEDVKSIVYSVLRHRLILSYKATLKKVSADQIIDDILNSISVE